ncbi:uncharacterized protein si:busm1-163l24.3 isoform X2 [Brienomyrus brachyistius]|uniref:uncharacterized protein si:busm1-163l24.3 isoform X2 n=1 Tax=Brienomyrus brachyistius TaxID=42636 RepID=UPI0020B265E2|nr:uncharacterized protein si:busm1-163l24.3 isoform X2 [Brienomyrus brachyistius]
MEGDEQTVRVCGLPTDIEEEKLTDKLYIHFLRQRNGGGEIASVTITKVHPGCALITFEDRTVAQRVVQHRKHILLVDDEKYELSVSLFKKNVNREEVLVQLQLTVNYSQLPLGKGTVTRLQKGFPNVELKFNPEKDLCTLSGSYSEVQALINQLLGLLETQEPEATSVLGTDGQGSKKNHDSKGKHHHRSSRSQEKTTQPGKALDLNVGISGEVKSERLHYSGLELDDYGVRAARREELSLEDYFLVLDSDIFRYLQQFCGEEYMQILRQHRVEVVDVTTQDVTTLYLRALEGAKGGSRKQLDRIQQVHGELSQLYQETEIRLRKEQLPKRYLLTTDLKATCEALQLQMPKLMLTDDETYIYLVGSSSDVSEAKQHLLYIRDSEEDSKQKGASHTQSGEQEVRDVRLFTSTAKKLDSNEDKPYKGTRAMGAEAGRQYMLAPKFKEVMNETPAENSVKSSPDDTFSHVDTQRDFSSADLKQMTSNEQRLGSGRVKDGGGFQRLPILQGLSDPGQSKLLKRTDSASASTSEVSSLRTLVPTSAVLPNKAKYFTGTPSTLQSDLFQERSLFDTVAPSPKLGAQSTLRRSNSFSGLVRSQQDEKERDVSKGNQRKSKTGTTGVSDSIGYIYSLEVLVLKDTWIYMKNMYHTWVEDIKSSVNIKEIKSADFFTLKLSGTDLKKLSNCQQEVKKHVSAVSADFSVQELSLTKLNAKDLNRTLEVCCMELRRKFHKVMIVQNPEAIYLSGPKLLCDEVYSSILGALSNTTKRKTSKEEEIFGVNANHTNLAPSQTQHLPPQEQIEFHMDQEIPYKSGRLINGSLLRCLSSSSSTLGSEGTQREDGSVPSRLGKNNIQTCDLATNQGESNQSVMKKDSIMKLTLGQHGTKGRASLNTDTPQTLLREASQIAGTQSRPKLQSSSAYKTQNILGAEEKNTQVNALNNHSCLDPEDQKNPLWENSKQKDPKTQEYESTTCSCGMNEGPVVRMACGAPFCSKCLVQTHSTCKVCHKAGEVSGIKGRIIFSELSLSLPGYPKNMTLKITYIIPNGIQGENHPNPGAPFQGGTFYAYLPLNEQVRRLGPLLEKAFARGLTFTVSEEGQVIWGSIPHKTSVELKSKNGYPDSSYLKTLSEVLTALVT